MQPYQDTVKLEKLARLAHATPPLHTVESFIMALTTASAGMKRCPLGQVSYSADIRSV